MFDSDCWILIANDDRNMIDEFARMQFERLQLGKRRAAKNDPTFLRSEDSIRIGYRGEWAVSRWLEIEMDFTTDAKQAMGGDLEFGIEVKATDNPRGNLYCSQKTLNDYLHRSPNVPIVCAKVDCWPWVELPGWMFAKDMKQFPFKPTNERHNAGYLVPIDKLRAMGELKEVCNSWKKQLQAKRDHHSSIPAIEPNC